MKIKIQLIALLQRIYLPWNINRFVFLILGITIVFQAAVDRHWIGIFFGLYFMTTGLFAWGCAGGHCQVPTPTNNRLKEIEYEEITN